LATLGRPASSAELKHFADLVAQNNGSVWKAGLVSYLEERASFAANTPADYADIVITMYKNITGSEDMPISLYDYYVGNLLAGGIKLKGLANAMLNDLGLSPRVDGTLGQKPGWQWDKSDQMDAVAKDTFANRLDVATEFTQALDTVDEEKAFLVDPAPAKALLDKVTADAASKDAALAEISAVTQQTVVEAQSLTGQTFTLTASAEVKEGTDGNDTFIGTNTTLVLDQLDGKGGTDTLQYNDATTDNNTGALVGGTDINSLGLSLTSVEVIEGRSVGALDLTTTNFSDVTTVKALQGGATTVTASATQNVEVSGATGAITVDGGKDVSITDNTADQGITVGGTTAPAGDISIADSKQGTGAIAVDGGVNVAVTAADATSGTVTIGGTTAASGNVTVSVTGTAYDAAATASSTMGAITVTGGKEVSVTESAYANTDAAKTDTSVVTKTQGAVTVNSDGNTTKVTVKQDAAVAAQNAVAAVPEAPETAVVTFSALTSGSSVTVGGLTFTASKDLTAAEVADAFENLTTGATQGQSPNGTYTGSFTAAYTSGTTTDEKLTFTGAGNVTNLTATGATVVVTDGTDAVAAVDGVAGIVNGDVTIDEDAAAAASITDISVDGYATLAIGGTNEVDALSNLSLANSSGTATVSFTTNGPTALNLTVDNVNNAVSLDGNAATVTNLNITTANNDSAFALTSSATTALSVAGTNALNLTGSTLSALQTVTISGAAGVTMDASGATVTSVDASGTSGDNTITVDAANATYKGGSGKDNVTLSTATVSNAVTLGDGDDTITLAAGTTSLGALISAGNGTDTISMAAADLDAATTAATPTFQDNIDGFERVQVGNVAATTSAAVTNTVDLANLDNIAYVITGSVAGNNDGGSPANNYDGTLNINNLASGGTVKATGAVTNNGGNGILNINIKDAATGTADSVTLEMAGSANITNTGNVNIADVETVNLVSTDTDTTDTTIPTHTLILNADAATKMTATGNANLSLTLGSGNTVLTELDASTMTGALTAGTNGTTAQTIKGGSGNDVLTANGDQDVLLGNDGNDTLTTAANADLVTLTGGAGTDTFVIGAPSSVNGYATITDLSSGEKISFDLTGGTISSFDITQITLASTAVFQDYANAAINAVGAGGATWFQYDGNTYVVADLGADDTSFNNGQDAIVKITGLVDLSTASFNNDYDSIQIA
jgi:S-layer protein